MSLTSATPDRASDVPAAPPLAAPAELLPLFERGDVFAVLRFRGASAWSELAPVVERLDVGQFDGRLGELLDAFVKRGPVGALGLLDAQTSVSLQQIMEGIDPDRDFYMSLQLNVYPRLASPLRFAFPFAAVPEGDRAIVRYTIMLPSSDPEALARAMTGVAGSYTVEALPSYVVLSKAREKGAQMLPARPMAPSAASAEFFDSDIVLSAYAPQEGLARLSVLRAMDESWDSLDRASAEFVPIMLLKTLVLGADAANDMAPLRREFEAHAVSVKAAGETLVIESAHAHTALGREFAGLMTAPSSALMLPTLTPPGGRVWFRGDVSMNTARLRASMDTPARRARVSRGGPSMFRGDTLAACMAYVIERDVSLSGGVIECLESVEGWAGSRPYAARVLAWGLGGTDVAALVAFEGDAAEAARVEAMWGDGQWVRGMKVNDDGTFVLIISPGKASFGPDAPFEPARADVFIDLARGQPPSPGALQGVLGASVEVSRPATYARMTLGEELGRFSPEVVAGAFAAPSEAACHARLHELTWDISQWVMGLERLVPEERFEVVRSKGDLWLKDLEVSIAECVEVVPGDEDEYARVLAGGYFMVALANLSYKERERSARYFARACSLGDDLACGDANAHWALERCLEPYYLERASAASDIRRGEPLSLELVDFVCVTANAAAEVGAWSRAQVEENLGRASAADVSRGQKLGASQWYGGAGDAD